MAPQATKGDLLELRVARLLFEEGYFVRRAVNLNMHFGEDFTVTDVDLLAIRFSPSLSVHTTIGECKTSEAKSAPRATDRVLWGRGLRVLLKADANFVVTVKAATDRVRRLAVELDTRLLDERDVTHRERLLGLNQDSPWGPHDQRLLEKEKRLRGRAKNDEELNRVYWFVRSEFWFLPPVAGLKRVLGACRVLERRWHPNLPEGERELVGWLGKQIFVAAVVALARAAGDAYRQPTDIFRSRLAEQLAAGVADYNTLREVSRQVDRYVTAVLSDAGVEPGQRVKALGAFEPAAPPYTEPLIETIERLSAEPRITSQLARLADWRVAESELSVQQPMPRDMTVIEDDGDRLLRTIGAFLAGQHIRLPAGVLSGAVRVNGEVAPTPSSVASRVPAGHDESDRTSARTLGGAPRLLVGVTKASDADNAVQLPLPQDVTTGRSLRMSLQNVGTAPAAIRSGVARSRVSGDMSLDVPEPIAPGASCDVTFRFPADAIGVKLVAGEDLEVQLIYGEDQIANHRLRWHGPGADDWVVADNSAG
jgi:hypothetical protein